MEDSSAYVLTSDDSVIVMLETARQSLLILGASEIEFCLRFLVNIAKSTMESLGQDMVIGNDPHDARYVDEAMAARDRGIERIALACGGLDPKDAFGAAAIRSLEVFVPVTSSSLGWGDVDGATLRHAYNRVLSAELLAHARTLYELTSSAVPREYALGVLDA